MKDLIEMAYEATKISKSKKKQSEIFAELFMEELKKIKGAELAPHLHCVFDIIKQEYVVTLTFPVSLDKFQSCKSNVE